MAKSDTTLQFKYTAKIGYLVSSFTELYVHHQIGRTKIRVITSGNIKKALSYTVVGVLYILSFHCY